LGAGEDAPMLADDLPFGDDDDALWIHAQVDRSVGEGRWHAIAVALKMNEAGRRDALGVLDEAVERTRRLHQQRSLLRPDVRDRAGLGAMRDLGP